MDNLSKHSISNQTKHFNLRCQDTNYHSKINITDSDEINLFIIYALKNYYVVFLNFLEIVSYFVFLAFHTFAGLKGFTSELGSGAYLKSSE
jgi:hypothetical protein